MKKLIPFTTCLLLGLAGMAHSQEQVEAVPYSYGMKLDIARVISMDEPHPQRCEVVEATMVYEDSNGQRHALRYQKQAQACLDY